MDSSQDLLLPTTTGSPSRCRVIPVENTFSFTPGAVAMHVLGIIGNLILLCAAAAVVIFGYQTLGLSQVLSPTLGIKPIAPREVGIWLVVSISVHTLLGLAALIAFRSRYRFSSAGMALSICSWLIWFAAHGVGMAALFYAVEKPFLQNQTVIAIGGLLWAALNTIGASVFATARSKCLRPVSRIIANDDGRYFFYLRSFESDAETSPDRSPLFYLTALGTVWIPMLLNPYFFVNFRRQNPEEIVLLKGMSRVYPVVAIGKPGERLPPLGASRAYVDHEHWQQFAKSVAHNSCAVVLLPNSTAGVVWEFTELCLRTHPSKVVIILPHALAALQWSRGSRETAHVNIWGRFLIALKDHPMAHRLPALLPSAALAMTFADDWSPQIWIGSPKAAHFGQIARYVAMNAAPNSPVEASV
jgi:hypothetical protein